MATNPYTNPPEEAEQITLANWLDLHKLTWMHCPMESKRPRKQNPKTGKWYSLQGQKLQRMGMKAGFPDVVIFDAPPACPDNVGTAIELKRRDGGKVTKAQMEWLDKLKEQGWAVAVCKGAAEAIEFLESLGYGRPNHEIHKQG